jgi:RimJ/RimL family protein N-acetyltransferase
MTFPFRQSERIYLRAAHIDDLQRNLRWFNDPGITRYLATGRFPIGEKQQREWHESRSASDKHVVFSICLAENDVHIGNCDLHDISLPDRNATIGIVIGERTQHNKGYGGEALRLLIDYAFNTLNLERLTLTMLDTNEPAKICYRRLGFVDEGRKRANRYRDGEWVDELVMGLLRGEWQPSP